MNPSPSKHTRFKKGRSGNPGGLRKGEIAKKTLKLHTQAGIADAYNKLINLSQKDLNEFLELKNIPIIQHIVAKALLNDIRKGSLLNTEKILNRIIGETPKTGKYEVIGNDGLPFIPPAIQFISMAN